MFTINGENMASWNQTTCQAAGFSSANRWHSKCSLRAWGSL